MQGELAVLVADSVTTGVLGLFALFTVFTAVSIFGASGGGGATWALNSCSGNFSGRSAGLTRMLRINAPNSTVSASPLR